MSWLHLSDTRPKARKDHRCELCGLTIAKGTVHVARRGIGDDGPCTFRMHDDCEKISRSWSYDDWECGWDESEVRRQLQENKNDQQRTVP